MKQIVPPLGKNDTGPEVVNLQNALLLMLEKAAVSAPRSRPLKEWKQGLVKERSQKIYGDTTEALVKSLQQGGPLEATGKVDKATAAVINELLKKWGKLSEQGTKPDQSVVSGKIFLEHGLPAKEIELKFYQHDFGGELKFLTGTKTQTDGEYSVKLDSDAMNSSIEVRAVKDGKEVTLFNPLKPLKDDTELNLVAPADMQPLEAEYKRMETALKGHAWGEKLATAKENSDGHHDLTVLHQKTGWDARLIALAAVAERLHTDEDLKKLSPKSSQILYGLLRAGLPSDKLMLAAIPPEIADNILEGVHDAGIVKLKDSERKNFKENFARFSREVRLNTPAPGGNTTYRSLLRAAGVNDKDQEKIADVYFNHSGKSAELWDKIQDQGISQTQIAQLKKQGKFAFLTGNSEQMTGRLMGMKKVDTPVDLVDRGFYRADAWRKDIFEQAGIPENRRDQLTDADKDKLASLIPSAYPDDKIEVRFDAYTEDMARKMRLSYPTETINHQLTIEEIKLPAAHTATVAVMNKAIKEGFRLGETPVTAFLKEHKEMLREGLPDIEFKAAGEQMRVLQRVFQITPGNEAMQTLISLGIDSAHDLMAYQEDEFAERFNVEHDKIFGKVPDVNIAGLIYRKASQVNSVTSNLFTVIKKLESQPAIAAITAPAKQRDEVRDELIKNFPTMESLFGSMDFCECRYCRSVLSPAAYFVDLLQFIDVEEGVWNNFLAQWEKKHNNAPYPHQDKNKKAMTPYDVLIKRRPDLPHIALTCENTHTTLPYIDIVNEILEYSVAHGRLDQEAVHNTGEAASETLLAEPQNILPQAYEVLRGAQYPLNLPFDLWLETVRRFCNYFATPLEKILEAFRHSDDLFASTQPYGRSTVFMESLGLSPAEVALFTKKNPLATWYELYGFSSSEEALTKAVDSETKQRIDLHSAKALARRLGVTYKEITEIIQTEFVNPRLNALVLLYRLGISIRDARLYQEYKGLLGRDSDKLTNEERKNQLEAQAVQTVLKKYEKFFGLEIDSLKKELEEIPFSKVLVLADPNTGCSFDETTVQYADGSEAKSSDFLRINLFVRLWRKLGWSIEELDRALTIFIPANSTQQFLKTTLIYLSHLKKLDEQLEIGEQSRAKLLTLWSDIPTTGRNSLYRQLFLTPGVLASNPVFDHPLGDYLSNSDVKMKDHLLAVQGALGLKAEEVELILKDSGESLETAMLSLSNISQLYRYGLLAKGLDLSINDLISLKQLSGFDPFKPLSSEPLGNIEEDYPFSNTLHFVAMVNEIRESGLSVQYLEYLFRHRFDETGTYRPDHEGRLTLIQTLAHGIRTIRAEHAVPADPGALTDELLQQKLGLVLSPEVAEGVLAMLSGTAEFNAEDFFKKHLLKQTDMQPHTGFLEQKDFKLLFESFSSDLTGVEKQKWEQEHIRQQRTRLSQAFFPFLQQNLVREFITRTMSAHIDAEAELVDNLLIDKHLLNINDSPLLDSLSIVGERGVTGRFFASSDCTGDALATLSLADADTGLRGADGEQLRPDSARSACLEGFLEVPMAGAYRFTVTLDEKDAEAELHFHHHPESLLWKEKATGDNVVLGEQPDAYLELKPGIPYRFSLFLRNLNQGEAQMFVQGETLPQGKLSRLVLYPRDAIQGAERAILLLSKTVQLAQALALSERELRYLTDGLSLLPTAEHEITVEEAQRLFQQFIRLNGYSRLKRELGVNTDDLIEIFEVNNLEVKEAKGLDRTYALIGKLFRRDVSMVKSCAELIFTEPSFADEESLHRLWEVLQITERFAVPAASLHAWTNIVSPEASSEQRFAIARDVRESIKANYGQESWQKIARSIFDTLRQQQRDALVAYVMHQEKFTSMEQLYEHFLIDPGMEPMVQTSRIRLAISSIQLFIQRSLLNLEFEVHPAAIIKAKHWQWMKRYRVWEANRKIFLFPENWLEPEFRDDKTHLFSELEAALLQSDVSADLAEDAFLAYLKKMDELARLDMVAMHIEDSVDPAGRILHVFGRTFHTPHKYFYRRYVHGMWTHWEPVTTEVQGDHLAPVIWRDRLYLFWVTFMDKPIENPSPTGDNAAKAKQKTNGMTLQDVTAGLTSMSQNKQVEMRLHWSEYLHGEWSTHESSGPAHVLTESVSMKFNPNSVLIHVSKLYKDGEERGVYISLSGANINKSFYLAGRNSAPEIDKEERDKPKELFTPAGEDATRYTGKNNSLSIAFTQSITTKEDGPGKKKMTRKERRTQLTLLREGGPYTLLPCNNIITLTAQNSESLQRENPDEVARAIEAGLSDIESLMKPFFCQNNSDTFFVEPSVTEQTIEEWKDWVPPPLPPSPAPPQHCIWDPIRHETKCIDLNIIIDIDDLISAIPPIDHLKDPLKGPVRVRFHKNSLRTLKDNKQDWLVNPFTLFSFDEAIIAPTGGVNMRTLAGGVSSTNVNSSQQLARAKIAALSSTALKDAGLNQSPGRLNVVTSSGVTSVLKHNLNELSRSAIDRVNR